MLEKTEIKIGPVTLTPEAEPPLPSLQEQARLVGEFYLAVNLYLFHSEEDLERLQATYCRLRDGEISAVFQQFSAAEIAAEKARLTFRFEYEYVVEPTVTLYDEELLNRQMLPIEQQLEEQYRTARAQLWATEHGNKISWAQWDTYRLQIALSQVTSLADQLSDPKAISRSASSQAEHLASAAFNIPGRSALEAATLAEQLLKSMFLEHRIALPIHDQVPLRLPQRIPLWAWEQGVSSMVPFWWTFEEEVVGPKKSKVKRSPTSRFATKERLRNSTHWILVKNQTALHQRAGWVEQSMAGLSVPRGFVPDKQAKKYEVLFYLGLPEYDDEEQPKPFSARETVEILQRFGRLHSYLHLGIRCALSQMDGRALELNEKDLLFFSGLEDAVQKGDLKRVTALHQIDEALRDLRTLSLFVRSKDKKIQTGRFPLFRIEPLPVMDEGQLQSLVARVDAGLWARSFYTFDAPNYDVATAVFSIPRNQLIASGFAVWLAANIWRFSNGKKVSLGSILREIIPRVKPENAEDWEGHNITWEDLEPDKDGPAFSSEHTKERRRWVRDQVAKLPATLSKHRIKITLHGSQKTGRSWEEFLDSKVSASFASSGKAIDVHTLTLIPAMSHTVTADDIRAGLQRSGMKQGEFAKRLSVSPALVTRWLKDPDDPRWSAIPPKYFAQIQEILAL